MYSHTFGFVILCLNVSFVYGICVYKFVYLNALEGQRSTSASFLKSNAHAIFETVSYWPGALPSHPGWLACPSSDSPELASGSQRSARLLSHAGWLACPSGLPVSDSPELVL